MKQLAIGLICIIAIAALSLTAEAGRKEKGTVVLEGQVVCSSCYFEADRKEHPYGSEADLKCAIRCAKKNIAQALAVVGETETVLYVLEPGKLKRKQKDWLDFIGKQVKVEGSVRIEGDQHYVQVAAITLLPDDKIKPASKPSNER